MGRGRGRSSKDPPSSKKPAVEQGTGEKGEKPSQALPPLSVPRWLQPFLPESPAVSSSSKDDLVQTESKSGREEQGDKGKTCENEGDVLSISGITTESFDNSSDVFLMMKRGISETSSVSSYSSFGSTKATYYPSASSADEVSLEEQPQKSPSKPERRSPSPKKKTLPTRTTAGSSSSSNKRDLKATEWRNCPYFTWICPHMHDMSIPGNEYLFNCRKNYKEMKKRLREKMDIEICRYHSSHHLLVSELENHEKECCARASTK